MIVAGADVEMLYKTYGHSGHISRLRNARIPSLQRIHHSTKRITKLHTGETRVAHGKARKQ
jgi:hypothetical protein